MSTHTLIGVGFGPSNIALAIALEEKRQAGFRIDPLFIEKQPSFVWHEDMLLEHAQMQISFLKDLVTLRNPNSRFTFINYLHQGERLQDFVNLKTFFPSRREFNDYLSWAAAQFSDQCRYGEDVLEIIPEQRGSEVLSLRVRSQDRSGRLHERAARNLVVSVGGAPRIPAHFQPNMGDRRIWHSSCYLSRIAEHKSARRIALIGAGQSAAEIFMHLHGCAQRPQVDLVVRALAIRPADDSPFANEIFNTDFVDHVYNGSASERSSIIREFRNTNYSSPSPDLIRQIFRVFYEQKVGGESRHRLLRRHEVQRVTAAADGVHLDLVDLDTHHITTSCYDAVVLATGYERDQYKTLLAPVESYLMNFEADRDYRLPTSSLFHPKVFVQGVSEASHGLGDTLLSTTSIRAGEIVDALLRAEQPCSVVGAA